MHLLAPMCSLSGPSCLGQSLLLTMLDPSCAARLLAAGSSLVAPMWHCLLLEACMLLTALLGLCSLEVCMFVRRH